MKLLASIFLFYFSLLIAQPMVTLVHNKFAQEKPACTMACCQHHKHANKPAKPAPFGCCNSDMNNPFAQYSCCAGFIPGRQNKMVCITVNPTILSFINTEGLTSMYYSDCWQPPKIS